jgi:hypothetical protein
MDKEVENKIHRSDGKVKIFNSPIEVGIRALIVLSEFYPDKIDFQRLLYFDYLLVNSGDIENGPESMHPKLPFRSSSVGIRRKDLLDGLDLLISKDVLNKEYSASLGVLYTATDLTKNFLNHFQSDYYAGLVKRAEWLKQKFSKSNASELAQAIESKMGNWGVEFSQDHLTRSDWFTKE